MKNPTKVFFCASLGKPFARKQPTGYSLRAALTATAALLWASSAFGDAMPSCPPGEKVYMNPVQPGAFHHNGGKCVKDPDYKPQPEPPKPTPEQEAFAKKKSLLAELEATAAALEAKTFKAQAEADKAKGTPDEAATKKAADDLAVQLAAVQREVQDAKKALDTPPTNTVAKTPEAQPKAETKTGGCSVSQPSPPAGLFVLLASFALFFQRRRAKPVQ